MSDIKDYDIEYGAMKENKTKYRETKKNFLIENCN